MGSRWRWTAGRGHGLHASADGRRSDRSGNNRLGSNRPRFRAVYQSCGEHQPEVPSSVVGAFTMRASRQHTSKRRCTPATGWPSPTSCNSQSQEELAVDVRRKRTPCTHQMNDRVKPSGAGPSKPEASPGNMATGITPVGLRIGVRPGDRSRPAAGAPGTSGGGVEQEASVSATPPFSPDGGGRRVRTTDAERSSGLSLGGSNVTGRCRESPSGP